MIAAAQPDNESERLAELEQLNILDTLPGAAYDDITLLASQANNDSNSRSHSPRNRAEPMT